MESRQPFNFSVKLFPAVSLAGFHPRWLDVQDDALKNVNNSVLLDCQNFVQLQNAQLICVYKAAVSLGCS